MHLYLLFFSILILKIQNSLQASIKTHHDVYVPYIEKHMSSLSKDDFDEDPVVYRRALQDVVEFNNPVGFRNGTTVFRQKTPIKWGKKVIVLSGYDDYIRRAPKHLAEQRVFLVLTRKHGTKDEYYVNYVYVREIFPGESEKGAVKINNKLHRIELDSWDRRGANNNLETRMGWSVCSKSFSISCLGDPTRLFSYEKGDEPDYPDEVGENREKSSGLGSNDPEPYSVMYYHEYFSDLADEFTHSWFVGASVMFATNIKLKINTLLEVAEISENEMKIGDFPYRMKREAKDSSHRVVYVKKGEAPTREEIKACLKELADRNVGGRGEGIFDKTIYGYKKSASGLVGDGSQGDVPLLEGGRGVHGNQGGTGAGLFKPIDSIGGFFSGFAGYKANQNSDRSAGTSFMNGIRGGSTTTYGISEGLADKLGTSMGVGKISNDRSHFDSLTDDIWMGTTSVAALGLDGITSAAGPLGKIPGLKKLAGLAGTGAAAAGSVIISPVKVALDFGKLGMKTVGLQELVGMTGSKDTAGIQFCVNYITERKKQQHRQPIHRRVKRSFGSKAVNMENVHEKSVDKANVDLYTPIGWRGLYVHNSEPYVGLGSCIVNDKITLYDLEKLNTAEEAVDFYLKTLRINCNEAQRAQMLDLVASGELIFNPDEKTFSVSPMHFARNTKKLLPAMAARFSQAFEMQVYTKVYAEEFRNMTKNLRNPDNLLIFRAPNTLRTMALTTFQLSLKEFPDHAIKLIRNMLVTLKTALVRLMQTWHVIGLCRRCILQEQYVVGDSLIAMISTIDWIMHQFEPGLLGKVSTMSDIIASYEHFYMQNRVRFAGRLAAYVLTPSGQIGFKDFGPNANVTFVEGNLI